GVLVGTGAAASSTSRQASRELQSASAEAAPDAGEVAAAAAAVPNDGAAAEAVPVDGSAPAVLDVGGGSAPAGPADSAEDGTRPASPPVVAQQPESSAAAIAPSTDDRADPGDGIVAEESLQIAQEGAENPPPIEEVTSGEGVVDASVEAQAGSSDAVGGQEGPALDEIKAAEETIEPSAVAIVQENRTEAEGPLAAQLLANFDREAADKTQKE
ncbi:unnamed protein product, partial [Amoebophrya sp. A25]